MDDALVVAAVPVLIGAALVVVFATWVVDLLA